MPECGRRNKPGIFSVWFRNETSLRLLWQPPYPADAFTRYKISILPPDAADSVLYVEREGDPPGPAQAAFKGLVPGRSYNITVESLLGSELSLLAYRVYRTLPSRPVNITVPIDDVTETSFKVTWMPPTTESEFDKYQVSLSGPDGARPVQLFEPDENPSTSFKGLTPGGSYTVTVKTKSGSIASWPATADVTLKPLPVAIIGWSRKKAQDGIIVWWTPATNSIQDRYKLRYYESGTSPGIRTVWTTSEPRLWLTTISPEKNYTVAVSAVSRGVESRQKVVKVPKRQQEADVTSPAPAVDVTSELSASDVQPLRDNFEPASQE